MNHKGSPMKSIPSILSIPEKLNSFFQRVIKFRLPVERRFSVRDILLALGALLLTVLRCPSPVCTDPGLSSGIPADQETPVSG